MKPPGEDSWPDLAGRLADGIHRLPVRVYYEDTDSSGNVYHTGYGRFMERGRTDYLRLLGVSHTALAAGQPRDRLGFVVARLEIDFLKPARLDDLLVVESRFGPGRGPRLVVAQAIRRGAVTLASGLVTVALVDGTGRPRRPPAGLAGLLRPNGPSAGG